MAAKIIDKRIASFLQLFPRAFREYRKQLIILVVLGFVAAIFEGIGVNALIPLFSFAFEDNTGTTDAISKFIEQIFSAVGLTFSVRYLLIFIAALFIIRAFLAVGVEYIKIKIISDYEARTRSMLFKKMLNSSWPHLIKQKLGYLETILMVDVPASGTVLNIVSSMLILGVSLVVYVGVALNIDPIITLLSLLIGLVVAFIFKPFLFKIKVLARERTDVNKTIAHFVGENILGMKTIKSTMAQGDEVGQAIVGRAENLFERLKALAIEATVRKNITSSALQPIAVIFIVLLFASSYRQPNFNLAALIVIVYLVQKIFVYGQSLQKSLNNLFDVLPHLQAILTYNDAAASHQERVVGTKEFVFKKQLQFSGVGFGYVANQSVLHNLNFEINHGEMVGIIGPSGVGKTTVVDLMLRLLTPTSGQLLVDDVPATEIRLDQWRSKIGYVSQDIFLMNETIKNNIRFYNQNLTEQEIVTAAQMANIDGFIQTLPEKYETVIGERGIMLSAGQRQRIVIARILARKPELLILDEATSALDNESEAQIQQVIKRLKGTITVVVIAHRLSTVMDADRLLVLEKGGITEQGSPQDLIKDKQSYFFKVYNIRET